MMQITQAERKAVSVDLRRIPALAKQQIDHAELPAKYKAARRALQECYRIDELKDISDKHSAIAHYAKQAKDPSLMYYAERIKLRAFERIGEILAEIKEYKERKRVAEINGVAIQTANRAYEASHIPKKTRDKLIESSPPPKVSDLAEMGRRYIPKTWEARGGNFHGYVRREEQIKRTATVCAHDVADYLRSVIEDLRHNIPDDNVGGSFTMKQMGLAVHPEDAEPIRRLAIEVIDLVDEFEQALPASQDKTP